MPARGSRLINIRHLRCLYLVIAIDGLRRDDAFVLAGSIAGERTQLVLHLRCSDGEVEMVPTGVFLPADPLPRGGHWGSGGDSVHMAWMDWL